MTSFLNINDDFISQQTDEAGKRYYVVHNKQKYPSVSTLVNSFKKLDNLKDWEQRLGYEALTETEKTYSSEIIEKLVSVKGKEAAHKIRDEAAKRGTITHSMCDAYFKQHTIPDDACFQRLLPFLQLCTPLAVETKVKWEMKHNDTFLGWAGRFDNVSIVDGAQLFTANSVLSSSSIPAIIDYKTWNKPKYNAGKTREGIAYYPLLTYYLQLTAYLAAFNQCRYYDVLIKDCFLVGVTETCKEPWIYHLNLDKINFLFKELKSMLLAYYNLGSYSFEDLESRVENYLGERCYIRQPKLPF